MPIAGIVPDWLFTAVAVVTVFTIMFDLGLTIVPGEFRSGRTASRYDAEEPVLGTGRGAGVGVDRRTRARSAAAGRDRDHADGHLARRARRVRRSLEPAAIDPSPPRCRSRVAALAVISMPLSIAAFDEYYGGTATVDPAAPGAAGVRGPAAAALRSAY